MAVKALLQVAEAASEDQEFLGQNRESRMDFRSVQHDMRLECSTYEVLQILSISLIDKTPLKELFEKFEKTDF